MAASKLTALTLATTTNIDMQSRLYIVRDLSGTPTSTQIILGDLMARTVHLMNVRLTLTSGQAVTVTDVTGGTSVYVTPVPGLVPIVRLYTGSAWTLVDFSELTLSLTGKTSNCYDIFLQWAAGAATVTSIAWTNTTTRATNLILQDNVYVAQGDSTKVYVGTVYLPSTGTCDDSYVRRGVWNYYNRRLRPFTKTYTKGGSSSYTTAAWRQYDGSSSAKVDIVTGVTEDVVSASVGGDAQGGAGYLAVGINSTTGQAPAVRSAGTLNSSAVEQDFFANPGLYNLNITEFGATGFTSTTATIQGFMMG